MNVRDKMKTVGEFFLFVRKRKNWVLIPVLLMVVMLILVAVFIEAPALLPFFYAIF